MKCHAIGRGAEVTTGKEPHLGDRVTSFDNLVPGELKRLSYLAMLGLAIRRGPSTKTTISLVYVRSLVITPVFFSPYSCNLDRNERNDSNTGQLTRP
ncbi:unnamed protein product [Heterotrigona itama]|uniref:Uncharacterized protein n=1 Tax=Heterotrigona itama TaxID=395501 RepID=A0A6V7HHK2_9HYME|nr:unnamed protein product [Heterotrigona itama]